jgi:hypothetical protein
VCCAKAEGTGRSKEGKDTTQAGLLGVLLCLVISSLFCTREQRDRSGQVGEALLRRRRLPDEGGHHKEAS